MPCVHEGLHVRTEITKDVPVVAYCTYPLNYVVGPGQALRCSMVMIPADVAICSQLAFDENKRNIRTGIRTWSVRTLERKITNTLSHGGTDEYLTDADERYTNEKQKKTFLSWRRHVNRRSG